MIFGLIVGFLCNCVPHAIWHITDAQSKPTVWGFPGGTVVRNPPANAGDTGSSPGRVRSHMSRSN